MQAAALATQQVLVAFELADQQGLLDKGLAQASRVLALQFKAARLAGELGSRARDCA